jgi:hypothetical protein
MPPAPQLPPQGIYWISKCNLDKHMVNNLLMNNQQNPIDVNNLRFSGGCQCGALRYEFVGPLGTTDLCHCRMCQKAFGSFGAVLMRVDLANFRWTRGQPSKFKSSALVDRGFCKSCGTPIYMFEQGDTCLDLAVGTMDNPNAISSLQSQIGVESRVDWFQTLHGLPEVRTEQTRDSSDLAKLKSLQHPDHDT